MMTLELVRQITEKVIFEEEQEWVSSGKKLRLKDVFRENYDLWNDRLFPTLGVRRLDKYSFLYRILSEAGYEIKDTGILKTYMSEVKAERIREKKNARIK